MIGIDNLLFLKPFCTEGFLFFSYDSIKEIELEKMKFICWFKTFIRLDLLQICTIYILNPTIVVIIHFVLENSLK